MYGIYLERDEILQIAICVIAISFALAMVFATPSGLTGRPIEFLVFTSAILVTAGSGFILHEMAHKLVAMFYGFEAKFRMWIQGLVLMLMTSMFGLLFAAPGAVYIYSNSITPRQNGIISLAGPATNVMIALVFICLELTAPIRQFYSFLLGNGLDFSGYGIIDGVLHVWRFGAAINIMLALFNMIPAFPLDGSKVFRWSGLAWLAAIIALLFLGSWIISPGVVIGWIIMLLIFSALSRLLFR
jgi:Zn-dependent protease